MGALSLAIPWAMQGLWAAPWLADVDGYSHPTIVAVPSAMGFTACFGGVIFGGMADRLARHGVPTETVFTGAISLMVTILILILAHAPVPAYLLFGGLSVFGSISALAFAIVGELYSHEMIGRVSSAFVLVNMSCAFLVQSGMGYILALWQPTADGHRPPIAYEAALAAPVVLQTLAFAWFLWSTAVQRRATRAAGSS